MGDCYFILIHPPQRIPQLFIFHHSFSLFSLFDFPAFVVKNPGAMH